MRTSQRFFSDGSKLLLIYGVWSAFSTVVSLILLPRYALENPLSWLIVLANIALSGFSSYTAFRYRKTRWRVFIALGVIWLVIVVTIQVIHRVAGNFVLGVDPVKYLSGIMLIIGGLLNWKTTKEG